MYDTDIAIKDVIEPTFVNAIMTAARSDADAESDQEKDWMQKARQVHCRPDKHQTVLT